MQIVKITAVGDILMWQSQIRSAEASDNQYSFDSMFEEVMPFLKEADLAIGNLETTFSGREKYYMIRDPETWWPLFNCPDELAQTLKKVGFDVLTTANNHCLDRGMNGLRRTLEVLDQTGFYHTGTYRSDEESKQDLMIEVNGVKIGILAFTYGTNLTPDMSEDAAWTVNLINKGMLERVYRMKKVADLTIVCLHFGIEFYRYQSIQQRQWVQQCFEHGADVVLGAHPHVIQPMKIKQVKDIDGILKDRFVIYSLGNFISDIMYNIVETVSSLILNITVVKDPEGITSITDVEYIPTWVYRNKQKDGIKFKVLPIQHYLRNKAETLTPEDLETMKKIWLDTTTFLGGNARS